MYPENEILVVDALPNTLSPLQVLLSVRSVELAALANVGHAALQSPPMQRPVKLPSVEERRGRVEVAVVVAVKYAATVWPTTESFA